MFHSKKGHFVFSTFAFRESRPQSGEDSPLDMGSAESTLRRGSTVTAAERYADAENGLLWSCL